VTFFFFFPLDCVRADRWLAFAWNASVSADQLGLRSNGSTGQAMILPGQGEEEEEEEEKKTRTMGMGVC
jgi:hypothetical protein